MTPRVKQEPIGLINTQKETSPESTKYHTKKRSCSEKALSTQAGHSVAQPHGSGTAAQKRWNNASASHSRAGRLRGL